MEQIRQGGFAPKKRAYFLGRRIRLHLFLVGATFLAEQSMQRRKP
jgi:hypothetical protein